jgi:hypothetical protein
LLSMLLQPPGVDRLGFPVIRPRGGLPAVVHAQDGHFERGVGGLRQLDECQGELRGDSLYFAGRQTRTRRTRLGGTDAAGTREFVRGAP